MTGPFGTGATTTGRFGAGLRRPRLVATDLDGTLLRPDGTLSTRTVDALAACARAGVAVVFVTARPPRWLADVAAHVGAHGVAICANGAAVVDVAAVRVVEDYGMAPELVGRLAALLRAAGGGPDHVHLAVERAEGFAAERGFVSEHVVPPGSPRADRVEDLLTASTLKLLLRSERFGAHGDTFARAVADAVGDLAEASDSGARGLGEIGPPGVTKASTLARWAAGLGVPAEAVWAVGDAPNDLPMLAWAGTAFAVANAHPAVLAAAAHRLPSNAEDGVAVLLAAAASAAG